VDGLQPGQMLGPYHIISQIGQGGMAVVYKAHHAAMDRYVAIKVLPQQMAENPEFMGRFQQEARTISRLEHPHILPVYDHGESHGIAYLVMRYLDAGTLRDRIARGSLPLDEVDRLFSQLADALDYAHSRGVIHRDLKPSNALMDERGNLFLTDFGIAKLLESDPHFTSTGALIGTPAYMSPEQAQAQKVDQRTDIYSLGIILYEMITGRVPYDAETPLAVILKHINEPLPLPSVVKPGISPSIERVILRALEKNPADRYATVSEFLQAWKRALSLTETSRGAAAVETVITSPPEPVEQLTPPAPSTQLSPVAPSAQVSPPVPAKHPTRSKMGCIIPAMLALGGLLALGLLTAILLVTGIIHFGKPTDVGAITPAAGPAVEQHWTSWTAANQIEVVAVDENLVYTGGWGGITIWDRQSGSVVRRYTMADGLPHPHVADLLVEPDGVLWAATDEGLVKIEGQQWTIYDMTDGLDSDTIMTLAESSQGLLAGTAYSGEGGGLNLYGDEGWRQVAGFPSTGEPGGLYWNVHTILEGDGGVFWVGTDNGLGRYDSAAQSWSLFFAEDGSGLTDNEIQALLLDWDDRLWVSALGNVLRTDSTLPGEVHFEIVQPLQSFHVENHHAMLQDAQGRFWFAGGSLQRFDPQQQDWATYEARDFSASQFYGIAEDEAGRLYFGSNNGLVVYDGEQFTTWRVPNVPHAERGFERILPAPDGSLWFVGARSSEFDRFDPAAETWTPLTEEATGVPAYCTPLAIEPGKGTDDPSVWCTIYGGGVQKVSSNSAPLLLTVEQGMPSDQVTTLAFAKDGTVWIGTTEGVAIFDGQQVTQRYDLSTGLAGNYILSLFAASDGSLWVGSRDIDAGVNGLSRLAPSGEWEHYGSGNPFAEGWGGATAMAEDANGALWVAASYDAVYKFQPGGSPSPWSRYASPDITGQLNAIATTPDGSVWVGMQGGGAGRLQGKDWQVFGARVDGQPALICPVIYDIYADASGAVYFAAEAGATRYVP
jgi:serine/threonine protein kinase/ligand-binding sensor domain-containing protein